MPLYGGFLLAFVQFAKRRSHVAASATGISSMLTGTRMGDLVVGMVYAAFLPPKSITLEEVRMRRTLFRAQNLLLDGILIVAFVLRVWGITFGLPYRYHIDEQFHVPWALRLLNGQFRMPAITHGPNIYMFILAIQDIIVFFLQFLAGNVRSASQFAYSYQLDPTLVYFPARLLSALSGTLTVAAVYALGKRLRNTGVGLFGAAVVAFSFLHVRQSHYAVPDILMTFCLTLAMYAIVRATAVKSRSAYALAGLLVGVATGMKATAGIAVVGLFFACLDFSVSRRSLHVISPWSKQLENALVSGLAFGVAYVISHPVVLLSPPTFLEELRIQSQWASGGFPPWQLDRLPAYLFYPNVLVQFIGIVPFLLSVMGILLEVMRGSIKTRLLAIFTLSYFISIVWSPFYFARFILPLVPLLALFAGVCADWLIRKVMAVSRSAMWLRKVEGVLLALALAVMMPSLLSSVRSDWLLTQTDTRTLAKEWIEHNLPPGSKIAMDWPTHGPPLATSDSSVPYAGRVFDVTIVSGTGLSDHGLDWYREQEYKYLIASSFIYQIPLLDERRNVERREFYASLDQELDLETVFSPYADNRELSFMFEEIYGPLLNLWKRERPGPMIKVYKIR